MATDYTQQLMAMPMPQLAQTPPNFIQGLGGALFPASPGMDPQAAQAAQGRALLQMGLGMMGAGSRPGATLGGALSEGYGRASQNYTGAMDQAFRNTLVQKESERQERADERQKKADERAERQDTATTAGRISSGIGSSKDPMSYWNLVKQMPEVQDTLGAYGIDPATITTPEQLKQVAQQFGAAGQIGGPAQQRAPLQLKSVMVDGKQKLVPEEMAVGMEPGYSPPMSVNLGAQGLSPPPTGYFRTSPTAPGLQVEPGGPVEEAAKKQTGETRTAAGYLARMENAEPLFGDYVPTPTDFIASSALITGGPVMSTVGNLSISPEGQQFYQAAADWSRAKLRKESGAVISEEEIKNELRTYFPVPGDSAEVVAQKRRARAVAVQGMRKQAGFSAAVEPAKWEQRTNAIWKELGGTPETRSEAIQRANAEFGIAR